MPKIVITEIDQTTPGVNAESFEVAYIPGCVDISQKSLYGNDGKYVGLEINKPTLFTSVSDFETLCGTQGLTFTQDVDYRTLILEDSTGFSSDAVPFDNIMFRKDTVDPAYVMAKELLSAGLNVLYERINKDENLKEIVPAIKNNAVTNPKDWSTNYMNYFVDIIRVKYISDATPPVLGRVNETIVEMKPVSITEKPVSGVDYYTLSPSSTTEYVKAQVDIDAGFTEGVKYFTQGRRFFALEGLEENKQELQWVIDVNGQLVQGEDVYSLTSIPEDWKTTYWNKYVECVSEITNVPSQLGQDGETKVAPPIEFVQQYVSNTSMHMYENIKGVDIVSVYGALEGVYDSSSEDGLSDKGNYSIKYLTSGGYPVYEYNNNSIVGKMVKLSEARGDCVAILDHTDNLDRVSNIGISGSLYKTVSEDTTFQTRGEYATMFTPWSTYLRTTVDKNSTGDPITSEPFRMPASFAYLMSLADSIQTNASWLAVAGTTRGIVGNLAPGGMTTEIPNGAADKMQPRQGIAINAITNIKPYGYTIWGNRTLKKNAENLTATSFLNIRNLVSDVKKTCYRAARTLTFEQNTEVLWVNFKSKIAPTLDRMLSGYGISGYKIVRDTQHEKAAEKATICAKVILYPVYAVEDFYITIVLKDDEITVESAE